MAKRRPTNCSPEWLQLKPQRPAGLCSLSLPSRSGARLIVEALHGFHVLEALFVGVVVGGEVGCWGGGVRNISDNSPF